MNSTSDDAPGYLAFNRRGELCGFWVRDRSEATAARLRAAAITAQADGYLTRDEVLNIYLHAAEGAFEALDNTLDDRGGYILVLTD